MHDLAPTAADRDGARLSMVWFDEAAAPWPAPCVLTHVADRSRLATVYPAPCGVEDPHLPGPVDQGSFERAAAATTRPGITALRARRLAECVRALADGQAPYQVVAASHAQETYDGLADLFGPLTRGFVHFGRSFGETRLLETARRESQP